MNQLYEAHSYYRRRNYSKCVSVCTELLEKNPYDEAAWVLKMRAMTKRVYVDDLESDDLSEEFLDDVVIATAPRPGTSIRNIVHTSNPSTGSRPRSSTGRPISGIARPNTQLRPGSAIDRTKTSRPLTSSARTIRLGTAAMLTIKDGPFIQVSRLNLKKYAGKIGVAKALFEYLFYYEGNIRIAMELAIQATQQDNVNTEWWWRVQLSKCYCNLNLLRNAEQELKLAIQSHDNVENFVRLARVFIRLDQPLMAKEICTNGLEKFPNDITILTELARLYEVMDELEISTNFYRDIVFHDAMNVEAIACIGLHHFYSEQPEMAMRYYRRALQMGVYSAEIYNNIGLCCLYSQQLDLTLACFQRAIDLATEPEIKAEVWYNLSHVALSSGDISLAKNCLSICLTHEPCHALAMNNLAVLEYRNGRHTLAKNYFATAQSLDHSLIEPKTNLEVISNQ